MIDIPTDIYLVRAKAPSGHGMVRLRQDDNKVIMKSDFSIGDTVQ